MEFQASAVEPADSAEKIACDLQPGLFQLQDLQLSLVGGGMADVVVR